MPKVTLTMDGETQERLFQSDLGNMSLHERLQLFMCSAFAQEGIEIGIDRVTVVTIVASQMTARRSILVEASFGTGPNTLVPNSKMTVIRRTVWNELDRLFRTRYQTFSFSLTVEPKPTVQFARL